jgi:hypothetical protein
MTDFYHVSTHSANMEDAFFTSPNTGISHRADHSTKCPSNICIHQQNPDSGSPAIRSTHDIGTDPLEMFDPHLSPWMKQRNNENCQRIDTSEIRAFVQVTMRTGQG